MEHRIRRLAVFGALAIAALAACDDDPAAPDTSFRLTACPTGPFNVNTPITLNFNQPVAAATVSGANIIVSDAVTGVEIPGSVSRVTPTSISFTPASPLPFQTDLRLRVQNLLMDSTNVPLQRVEVCEFTTQDPPITQLFWSELPSATGSRLTGVTLVSPDSGYVLSQNGTVFRRRGADFEVVFNQPYYGAGNDLSFVNRTTGFTLHSDGRADPVRRYLLRTANSGLIWDTVSSTTNFIGRIFFREVGTTTFGVVLGGGSASALFMKYNPTTGALTTASSFAYATNASDVDFPPGDTALGAAVSNGSRFGTFEKRGRVFVTANGGASWTDIGTPGIADTFALTWNGVAVKKIGTTSNLEIWAVGGNGRVLRITQSGASYTAQRLTIVPGPPTNETLVNPDTLDPTALVFTDIQFAPDNQNKGWIVGAVRIGVVNGVPQYQGLIFETTNGGTTWTRQGVQGAEQFGATFPRLNRISVLNANQAWIIGDAGFAIAYRP